MKIADKLLNLVGVGRERGLPPPRLVAISDGLLVTERSAEAWFLISVANTDLATEAEQDSALDAAVSAAATILGDRLSHLKVVWGRSTGQDYIDSVAGHYRLGDHDSWAQTRADRIDEIWDSDNPDLDLAGVVVNRVPGISVEAERRIEELGKVVGRRAVWHPFVPQRVIASQAVSERRPIHHYGYRAADLSAAFDALWAKLRRRERAGA